ncbi:hypothetical protein HMPREF9061_00719 [Actinomyces sp. oral taxon 181 str. F0379]|nr:hypothetical protein HMPREF9061_00719 [Actinomyces sp. oral taxon 181 str. F0379]
MDNQLIFWYRLATVQYRDHHANQFCRLISSPFGVWFEAGLGTRWWR